MARVTIEDCLKHKDNRFELIMDASLRARQIANGSEAGVSTNRDKPTVVALREIAEGMTDLYQKEAARIKGLQVAEASTFQKYDNFKE